MTVKFRSIWIGTQRRKMPRRKRKPVDLSAVFDHGDLDEAQERYDELPKALTDHLIAIFAHKAKLGPDPGFYSGPEPKKYEDDE